MIEIIDIGASAVDGPAPYEPLLIAGLAHVTGFDFQIDHCPRSDKRASYLPVVIADGYPHSFHRYAAAGLSGLFPLRSDLHVVLPEATKWSEQLGESEPVMTERLDDLNLPCDYLKLDCQGSELMVLQNAHRTLRQCVVVQVEVSFFPLYSQQPLFAEVDAELRNQAFFPWSILAVRKSSLGQLLEADMLYMRYWPRPDWLEPAARVKFATIVERCYGAGELAELLREGGSRRDIGEGS